MEKGQSIICSLNFIIQRFLSMLMLSVLLSYPVIANPYNYMYNMV